MTCEHDNFHADVDVHRLTRDEDLVEIEGYTADVRIRCTDCGEHFVFIGAPVGIDPTKPTMGITGREGHLPIRPESSDPSFGLGLLGFKMRVDAGNEQGTN